MRYKALAETRADRGAHFLDGAHSGWYEKITEPVGMMSRKKCILAQVYGTYRAGCAFLTLSDEAALELGFRADSRECQQDIKIMRQYYDYLDAAFAREVEKRLHLV